jgi:hypothetical protein
MNFKKTFLSTGLPALALVLLGLLLFSSAGRDDSYISYAAADALARTGRILNINGDPQQQATSILWVVVLAAAKRLSGGMPLAVLGPLLAILFGALAIAAVPCAEPQRPGLARWLVALNFAFVYWAFSGMETAMVGFLVALWLRLFFQGLDRDNGGLLPLAGMTALLTLCRPEMVLILASFLAMGGLALAKLKSGRTASRYGTLQWVVAVSSLAASGANLLYNQATTGHLFPLPVIAKAGHFSVQRLLSGLRYLRASSQANLSLLAAFLWLAISGTRAAMAGRDAAGLGHKRLFAALFVLAWILFVAFAGGDWMEGGRFVAPIIPVIFAWGLPELGTGLGSRAVVAALIAASVFNLGLFAATRSTGMPANQALNAGAGGPPLAGSVGRYSWFDRTNRIHLRDVAFIEQAVPLIQPYLKDGPKTVLSIQMGMVPYYLRQAFGDRLRFYDLRGLATDDFLRCGPTAGLARGGQGLLLDYPFYFENFPEIAGDCGMAKPFFIFDLNDLAADRIKLLQDHGYTMLYEQHGMVAGWGCPVPAEQFLAVRSDAFPSPPPLKTLIWKNP